MSTDRLDWTSPDGSSPDPGDQKPPGVLPRLNRRQVKLDEKLGLAGPGLAQTLVANWNSWLGGDMVADRFTTQWRASGLRRPGIVAHLIWPRLRSRLAFGIDPPLAHAVVDRLLGYERTAAESRLQVTPVEWGVLTFVIANALERLDQQPGPLGPWDLMIDRVGPDPFDCADLGPVVTWRWRVRLGSSTGSARLWIPESLLLSWLEPAPRLHPEPPEQDRAVPRHPILLSARLEQLASQWHVEAGTITLEGDQMLDQLGAGRLLLIDQSPLTGTAAHPVGAISLVQSDLTFRRSYPTRLDPESAGTRVIITSELQRSPTSRTSFMADSQEPPRLMQTLEAPANPAQDSSPATSDLMVTLTVELGRINIPLGRLVNLHTGDIVELGRQSGELVDLVSNGRLVARGELVQVDTELGIRVTHVLL